MGVGGVSVMGVGGVVVDCGDGVVVDCVIVCDFIRNFICTTLIIKIFNNETEFANIIGYAFIIIADIPKNILAIASNNKILNLVFFL